jgi:hypothetical protein
MVKKNGKAKNEGSGAYAASFHVLLLYVFVPLVGPLRVSFHVQWVPLYIYLIYLPQQGFPLLYIFKKTNYPFVVRFEIVLSFLHCQLSMF